MDSGRDNRKKNGDSGDELGNDRSMATEKDGGKRVSYINSAYGFDVDINAPFGRGRGFLCGDGVSQGPLVGAKMHEELKPQALGDSKGPKVIPTSESRASHDFKGPKEVYSRKQPVFEDPIVPKTDHGKASRSATVPRLLDVATDASKKLMEVPTCRRCRKKGHATEECAQKYAPKAVPIESLAETQIEVGEFYTSMCSQNVCVVGGVDGSAAKFRGVKTFAEAKIAKEVLKNIISAGYTELTPVQVHGLEVAMSNVDMVAIAPTGSGKTAAYLFPMITKVQKDIRNGQSDYRMAEEGGPRRPRCLILEPTRELAIQVFNEARKFARGTDCIPGILYGGTSCEFQRRNLSQNCSLLVATVGRLMHFVGEECLSLDEVKYLVVDEADKMLDMGLNDKMVEIFEETFKKDRDSRQTLMISATFPLDQQHLAHEHLRTGYVAVHVNVLGGANPFIKQTIIQTTSASKRDKFLELLNIDVTNYEARVPVGSKVFTQKTLVFVETKKFADMLAAVICLAKIPCITFHSDRDQSQREEALRAFRHGDVPVLVATAVAERGLNIRGIDHVINYDLPKSRREYVHRIGRTGRLGNPGRATSFYDPERDAELAPRLVEVLTEVEQEVPKFLLDDARVR